MKELKKTIEYSIIRGEKLDDELEKQRDNGWIAERWDYEYSRFTPEVKAIVVYIKELRKVMM